MGDYIQIYRRTHGLKRFYAYAFDSQGWRYMWCSPDYWFAWTARRHAIRDAEAYITRTLMKPVSPELTKTAPDSYIERIYL